MADVLMSPQRPQDIWGVQMPLSPMTWGTYGIGDIQMYRGYGGLCKHRGHRHIRGVYRHTEGEQIYRGYMDAPYAV